MIVFLVLALLGFVASLIVHVSTFAAAPPVGMRQTWPLHIGIFIVFLPMLLNQQRQEQSSDATKTKAGTLDNLICHAPRWMRLVSNLCFTYAIVNFVIFMGGEAARGREGKISTVDGQHVVRNHGAVVRTVSEAEFRAHEARIARGFSGHWMLFYWASFVGIYDGLRQRRAARQSCPRPPELPAVFRQASAYERAPSPRLSPWLHATLAAVLPFACFVLVPLGLTSLLALVTPWGRTGAGGGWFCLLAPLFFGGALGGFLLAGRLMAKYLPAACPACGGPAYASGPPLRNDKRAICYTCRECGQSCGVDGAKMD